MQSLLDRQEISELLVRYAIALDERDWELLESCFVPDATAYFGGARKELAGYQAIEATCRHGLEPLDASQHFVSAPSIEIDGDRARARCYVQAQHVRHGVEGGDSFIVAGTYADQLERSGGWRIRRRELHVSWTEGNPRVLGRETA